MKDVGSCEKPRGAANRHRSEDFRIGKPESVNTGHLPLNKIGGKKRTQGTETSKYLQEKKARAIPQVAASERG